MDIYDLSGVGKSLNRQNRLQSIIAYICTPLGVDRVLYNGLMKIVWDKAYA